MTDQAHLDHAPGGRLDASAQDTHHQGAADHGGQHVATAHELAGYVLPTSDAMPQETIPRMVVLSAANPFLRILPRDRDRRRAILCAIDNDVLFTESEDLARQLAAQVAGGAASSALIGGAYWPKTSVLQLESRDQMFAVASTQTGTSRVSVIVERYVARANPPV